MSITPKCNNCNKELSDFGGILLSPPDNNNNVRKFHLCISCYKQIVKEFVTLR